MCGILLLGRLVQAVNPKLAMLLLAARIADNLTFRITRMPGGKINVKWQKKKKLESYFVRNALKKLKIGAF